MNDRIKFLLIGLAVGALLCWVALPHWTMVEVGNRSVFKMNTWTGAVYMFTDGKWEKL